MLKHVKSNLPMMLNTVAPGEEDLLFPILSLISSST